ncbi:STAS domain-containing protein [Aquimarina latercula]|uniref:STAS domain-containing protein n=1 Tax=Aquimarina latercula TaxID=987 RepID=UPI0004255051|nr:STAS domain-containing protein [Aquimarina latercula]
MALKITNNYGVYELEGNVEGTNTMSLKHHFEQLMSSSEKIVLSLEKVRRIDAYGIQVLTNLYNRAIKNNKIFYMIGSENDMINKAFGKMNIILKKNFL